MCNFQFSTRHSESVLLQFHSLLLLVQKRCTAWLSHWEAHSTGKKNTVQFPRMSLSLTGCCCAERITFMRIYVDAQLKPFHHLWCGIPLSPCMESLQRTCYCNKDIQLSSQWGGSRFHWKDSSNNLQKQFGLCSSFGFYCGLWKHGCSIEIGSQFSYMNFHLKQVLQKLLPFSHELP